MAFDIISGKENQEWSHTSSCFFPFMVTDDLKSWSHSGSQSEGIFYFVFHHLPHIMHLPRGRWGFHFYSVRYSLLLPKSPLLLHAAQTKVSIYEPGNVLLACLLACIKTLRLHPRGAESGAPCRAQEPVFGCFLRKGRRKTIVIPSLPVFSEPDL